jgi:hypothetical protein
MMAEPIELYIDRLKLLTGATSDTELAESIGVAKQTISSWRRRGTVPTSKQYFLTSLLGPEAAFYPEVGYATTARERQVVLAAFLELFDRLRERHDPSHNARRYSDWAQALLNFEDDLQKVIRATGFVTINEKLQVGELDRSTLAQYLVKLVAEGKLEQATRSFETFLSDGPDKTA